MKRVDLVTLEDFDGYEVKDTTIRYYDFEINVPLVFLKMKDGSKRLVTLRDYFKFDNYSMPPDLLKVVNDTDSKVFNEVIELSKEIVRIVVAQLEKGEFDEDTKETVRDFYRFLKRLNKEGIFQFSPEIVFRGAMTKAFRELMEDVNPTSGVLKDVKVLLEAEKKIQDDDLKFSVRNLVDNWFARLLWDVSVERS